MEHHLSPTIQRLRCFPKDNKRRNYPKGQRQPISKEVVQRFCDLISTSLVSTAKLLADNPDLPTFKTIESWRWRYPWVQTMWNHARKQQAEFLVQHCLDMAAATDPKSAHVTRVKFDIYRFLASKFHPDVYGDKSQHQPSQTTVNVGVSISPERLSDLRLKLDHSRVALLPKNNPPTSHDESRTVKDVTHQTSRNAPKVVYNTNGERSNEEQSR